MTRVRTLEELQKDIDEVIAEMKAEVQKGAENE